MNSRTISSPLSILALAMLACGLTAPPASAANRTIRVGVATPVINVTYPWLTLPKTLGYWAKERIDVQLISISGSSEGIQQLASGNLDFAEIGASAVISAAANNGIALQIVMDNTVSNWSVSVLDESPYHSMADLKGKRIGIVSLASSGVAMLKSYAKTQGLDPEKDLSIIPVGVGAPALLALKNGNVEALMFWASATAGFQELGGKLRLFADPAWEKLPDFSLVTTKTAIDKMPEVVEGVVRGATMATIYAAANPDCARKLQWANYPDTVPSGVDEQTAARRDMRLLQVTIDSFRAARALNDEQYWGSVTIPAIDGLQSFMLANHQISKNQPVVDLVIHEDNFFKRVNNFDAAAIEEQAKLCAK